MKCLLLVLNFEENIFPKSATDGGAHDVYKFLFFFMTCFLTSATYTQK